MIKQENNSANQNSNIFRRKSNRRKSVISVELEKFKAKIPISKETKKQLVRH